MTPSKPNDGGREEGPSEGGSSTPSEEGIDWSNSELNVGEYGNRSVRLTAGAAEIYAYHDYPMKPWRSPLYVGARLGPLRVGALLRPESRLRPFSGGRR